LLNLPLLAFNVKKCVIPSIFFEQMRASLLIR